MARSKVFISSSGCQRGSATMPTEWDPELSGISHTQ
jgi:hypothetical protein